MHGLVRWQSGGVGWLGLFGGYEWWVGVWFGLVWLPRVVDFSGLDGLVAKSGGFGGYEWWVRLPLPA